MPQVLKPEVRARILDAALEAFAEHGYAGASMSDIARRAGMAVANLYRYFAGKEALFEAALPTALVQRFDELLAKSVRAHVTLAGVAPGGDVAGAAELLDFWIEHRLAVVILLDRAEGSAHEGFAARFVERLVALALAEIQSAEPGIQIPREARLVLTLIFENTRRSLAAVLEASRDERAIRDAIGAFRRYQLAGLAAFTRGLIEDSRGRVRSGT